MSTPCRNDRTHHRTTVTVRGRYVPPQRAAVAAGATTAVDTLRLAATHSSRGPNNNQTLPSLGRKTRRPTSTSALLATPTPPPSRSPSAYPSGAPTGLAAAAPSGASCPSTLLSGAPLAAWSPLGVRPGAGRLAASGLAVARAAVCRGTSTLQWAAGQHAAKTSTAERQDSLGIAVDGLDMLRKVRIFSPPERSP